jgi:hypothetical protein
MLELEYNFFVENIMFYVFIRKLKR